MDGPEPRAPGEPGRVAEPSPPRYGRYVGLLGLLILALITFNTVLTKPNGDSGVLPGQPVPPFAVPLALGSLEGDANVATPNDLGAAGKVPACSVRKPQVLNICELYERGPVVLALFVDSGSCPAVLSEMQTLLAAFPKVGFVAVAIKEERGSVRRLVGKLHLSFPVGLDRDGALAAIYKVASCPQLTFVRQGGVTLGKALLSRPSLAALRARVKELSSASVASSAG